MSDEVKEGLEGNEFSNDNQIENRSTGKTILTEDTDPKGKEEPTPDDNTDKGTQQEADAPKDDKKDADWKLETQGLGEDQVKEIEAGCKKLGMSKEQAEQVINMRKAEADQWEKTIVGWQQAIVKDPEFGCENYQQTVISAKRALNAYDPSGVVRQLLDQTGYGNHPEIIKLMARAGRDLSEEKIITSKGGSGNQKSLADRLYN